VKRIEGVDGGNESTAKLNFNPTNQLFTVTNEKQRPLFRAVYSIQSIYDSVQMKREVGYLEIKSV
jgi:hypothetical protein